MTDKGRDAGSGRKQGGSDSADGSREVRTCRETAGRKAATPLWMRVLAGLAGVFGLLTVISGGRVLFGPEEARIAAGAYMPFVVWFNFLAGFAYILTAWAMWRKRRWACALAAGLVAATLVVFAVFGFRALTDTPFEMRTVGAMTLRSGFWLVMAHVLCRWHGRVRGKV